MNISFNGKSPEVIKPPKSLPPVLNMAHLMRLLYIGMVIVGAMM